MDVFIEKKKTKSTIPELEMPLQLSLCNMEDIGFPTSSDALQKLFQQMVDTMKKLETKIYELHGSRFNLGSSSAVARVCTNNVKHLS